MIDVAKLVAKLGAMGHTASEIAEVLHECMMVPGYAMEATTRSEEQRRKDRERQAAKRARDAAAKSEPERDVTRDSSENVTPSHADKAVTPSYASAPPRAQVVIPLSSLRSESLPLSEPTVPSPKPEFALEPEKPPPKSKRGTRIPEDWEPTERDWQRGRDEGLTDGELRSEVVEFRNYWLSEPGGKSAKLDWGRTWHNRVIALGKRKREKLARQNGPRPGGRGTWGLADHLMWERSQDGDGATLPD